MRHSSSLILLAGLTLAAVSCKEKKQTEDIIATKYVPKRPQAPIAMPSQSDSSSVEWMNRQYLVVIRRQSDDSLQMVSDESSQKYIDNRIRLTVIRHEDGSLFYDRWFTKGAFLQYVDDESMRRNGILGGMRLVGAEGSVLHLAVVVGLPDAVDDVFVPLVMTLDAQGNVGIRKDDDMGMLDYE